jgi:hypothetical protein
MEYDHNCAKCPNYNICPVVEAKQFRESLPKQDLEKLVIEAGTQIGLLIMHGDEAVNSQPIGFLLTIYLAGYARAKKEESVKQLGKLYKERHIKKGGKIENS